MTYKVYLPHVTKNTSQQPDIALPTIRYVILILLALLLTTSTVQADDNNVVYIPFVTKNYVSPEHDDPTVFNANKGIALVTNVLSDLDEVGASWYYTWTHYPKPTDDSRHIPMSYYGLFDDNLPVDYDGFVLFLNEPNSPAPFGSEISPRVAADRYVAFVTARPNAKLVVGNCSAWSQGWYLYFVVELMKNYPDAPLPEYYGFHGYIESYITPQQLDDWWGTSQRVIEQVGGQPIEVWITEFADTTGDTESLTDLMDVIQGKAYITRFAYFTNRYDPEAAYIPDGWHDFNLIEDDGSLSPIGAIYAQR